MKGFIDKKVILLPPHPRAGDVGWGLREDDGALVIQMPEGTAWVWRGKEVRLWRPADV